MKRRGIGNVIATAIMVFLLIFTISQLYIYSFDQLDDYNRVAAQVFSVNAQKQNEHLSIQNVNLDTTGSVSGDILATLVILNTGGVTSHLVEVWFNNLDQSTNLHSRISLSVYVGQGLSTTLSNLDTGIAYNANVKIVAKVFTELGNSVSVELLPPGLAGTTSQTLAQVSLTIVPPNPITTNDILVLLTVTNTNTLGAAFTNLSPDICLVEGSYSTMYQNAATCKTAFTQCASLSYPVTCDAVSTASPASISFLPYGATATFQWIYVVETLVADSPITIAASYVALNTANLVVTGSTPQVASQVATVRSAGGASSESGGSFLNISGALVNYFNTFYAQQPQVSNAWVIGTALTAGKDTIFRVNVTNLSSDVIQFGRYSELLLTNTKTGNIYEFYVVQACVNYQPFFSSTATCGPNAYPSNGYILAPLQTITLYFTATTDGGTNKQSLGSNANTGTTFAGTISVVGSKFQGAGLTLTSGLTQTSISLVTAMTSTFTLIVQSGWNTVNVSVCKLDGTSCTSATTTSAQGVTTITGLTSAYYPGFILKWPTANAVPANCLAYASNQCKTLAYGVYTTATAYAQAAPFFAVRSS